MSTAQVPLLRAPVPSRGPPRLGLSIPGSPNNVPQQPIPQLNTQVNNGYSAPILGPPQPRRGPPKLSLATPGNPAPLSIRPVQQQQRSSSYASPVAGANQQYAALGFAMTLKKQVRNSPDTSGMGSESAILGGTGGTGRRGSIDWENENLDADDLDDEGWRSASLNDRIIELGSLGEGAGGAVTRCKLKGGKTVFAMKVCPAFLGSHIGRYLKHLTDMEHLD